MEVGYDLEGVIPDGFAGETSRQVMAPYFRQGELRAGAAGRHVAGHRAYRRRSQRQRDGPARCTNRRSGTRDPLSPGLVMLTLVLFFIVVPMLNRARPAGGGAGRGAAASVAGAAATMGAPGAVDRPGVAVRRAASAASAAGAAAVAAAAHRGDARQARGGAGGIMRQAVMAVVVAGRRDGCERLFVQHVRQPGRGREGAVGAGREPAEAAKRPHPEPGGDHQGLRAAGAGRLQGHRRLAREAGRRANARRDDVGGQRAVGRPGAAAGRWSRTTRS